MTAYPTYRRAIEWIAWNDETGSDEAGDAELVGDLVSSSLVADLFDRTPRQVGEAVVRLRRKVGLVGEVVQ